MSFDYIQGFESCNTESSQHFAEIAATESAVSFHPLSYSACRPWAVWTVSGSGGVTGSHGNRRHDDRSVHDATTFLGHTAAAIPLLAGRSAAQAQEAASRAEPGDPAERKLRIGVVFQMPDGTCWTHTTQLLQNNAVTLPSSFAVSRKVISATKQPAVRWTVT
ncbi:MAG: hypothetical protein EA424_22440 [Planctomycetaceae bacterium]|nr:MAG: hypothetical protein EA424_22440 [Planctomycetaceae bacterium]